MVKSYVMHYSFAQGRSESQLHPMEHIYQPSVQRSFNRCVLSNSFLEQHVHRAWWRTVWRVFGYPYWHRSGWQSADGIGEELKIEVHVRKEVEVHIQQL